MKKREMGDFEKWARLLGTFIFIIPLVGLVLVMIIIVAVTHTFGRLCSVNILGAIVDTVKGRERDCDGDDLLYW